MLSTFQIQEADGLFSPQEFISSVWSKAWLDKSGAEQMQKEDLYLQSKTVSSYFLLFPLLAQCKKTMRIQPSEKWTRFPNKVFPISNSYYCMILKSFLHMILWAHSHQKISLQEWILCPSHTDNSHVCKQKLMLYSTIARNTMVKHKQDVRTAYPGSPLSVGTST